MVKLYFSLIVCLLLTFTTSAQNLVPNGDFEIFSSCPTAQSGYNLAIGWDRPNGAITTPDYYNTCNTSNCTSCSCVGVPNNFGGQTYPQSGDAYYGIIGKYGNNFREYAVRPLSTTLVAGQTYTVSAYIKASPNSAFEIDKFGILLTSTFPYQASNQPITASPQLESGLVSKSLGWHQVQSTFVATGGEQYIAMGVFRYDTDLTIVNSNGAGGCALSTSAGYLYIDQVVLVTGAPLSNAPINLSGYELDSRMYLQWTDDEPDPDATYYLQRGSSLTGFTNIGQLPANGARSYELKDPYPYKGNNYYRIMRRGLDGNSQVSDVLKLGYLPQPLENLHFYPNPLGSEDILRIEFESDVQTTAQFQVVNTLGQVMESFSEPINFGWNVIQINPKTDATGLYFLRTNINGLERTNRLMIR